MKIKKTTLVYIVLTVVAIALAVFAYTIETRYQYVSEVPFIEDGAFEVLQMAASKKAYTLRESFDKETVIEENWPMQRSGNRNWWVSSGAYLFFADGVGSTIKGELDEDDPWVRKYKKSNARDTADGLRPQNIFRLVFKKKSEDLSQEVYARITYYDPSESEYRNGSNGILLFNRYQDEFNLYYAGIRVDGQAVVKKKLNGVYYTLGISTIIEEETYDRENNPNLLPVGEWIGVRSEITTKENGDVVVRVFTDIGRTGNWTLALEAIDDGGRYGKTISRAGYAGIRTDFMDVEFDDYIVMEK